MYLFFSAFLAQVPLVHSPTWQMENKPPILLRAMQACGALFVKTRTALNFISETLASTRDVLLQEFVSVVLSISRKSSLTTFVHFISPEVQPTPRSRRILFLRLCSCKPSVSFIKKQINGSLQMFTMECSLW